MLEHFLVTQLYVFFLVFCRLGSGIMILPGFGEAYVPPTIRLGTALMIALLLTPLLGKSFPPLPGSPYALALLVMSEILIGIFIGTICNILISVTHLAGMLFSFQSGTSSDVIFDVTQSSQGSVVGNFIGILAIVLIFSTNLHHMMLRGITDSYTVFVPGKFPPLHDFVESIARVTTDTFSMAIQISAPIIIAGTLLFLGAGILSRLMPTVQVFFIIIPPQLLIGFFILATTFSAMMLWYMEFYRDQLTHYMGYLQ